MLYRISYLFIRESTSLFKQIKVGIHFLIEISVFYDLPIDYIIINMTWSSIFSTIVFLLKNFFHLFQVSLNNRF